MTDKPELIKNIEFSKAHTLVDLVDYQEKKVVSRTLASNPGIGLTVFAFDRNEGLSTHSAPGDAMVQILDGEAQITIGGEKLVVKTGEVVVMPADIPHALHAETRFKMLLTLVKKPKKRPQE